MASRACGVLAGALAAGVLSACAVVDTVDPRYDTVNRAAAKARNEAILLNIVRASHNEPLNFVVFSRVSGTTSVGAGAGLPNFGVGPAPLVSTVNRQFLFGSSTLSGSTSANNSFDISLLESKDFYTALLSPVDLPTLNYFVRQGYSHELLFWLFTESVEETAGGVTVGYQNSLDPNKACRFHPVLGREKCFNDLVDIAVLTGLTVEVVTVEKTLSTRLISQIHGRFCFDRVLSGNGQADMADQRKAEVRGLLAGTRHAPLCKTPWNPIARVAGRGDGNTPEVLKTDTLEFRLLGTRAGPVTYRIVTRSTFGIYQYLGQLLARDQAGTILTAAPAYEDKQLLNIIRGYGPGCFVDLSFHGQSYCVPEQGAESTKRIFGLLAQLLALKTQAGDLAITPSVRVTP